MKNNAIFDRTIGVLRQVLDLRMRSQQVMAANIANADTPGYAPGRLIFEKELQNSLQGGGSSPPGHPAHFSLGGEGEKVEGRVIRTPQASGIGDRNGVEVDQEMIALAENQILYEAATQMLNKKLGLVKYVVQEGR